MPNRFKSYRAPTFEPTGVPAVDDSLGAFSDALSNSQTEDKFEQERVPYVRFTERDTSQNVGGAPGVYTGTTVQLLGAESVIVYGFLKIRTAASVTGALRIRYPGGTTVRRTQAIFLQVQASGQTTLTPPAISSASGGPSTVLTSVFSTVTASVGNCWSFTPEFQSGGKTAFDIITSGNGTILAGSIVVDVR